MRPPATRHRLMALDVFLSAQAAPALPLFGGEQEPSSEAQSSRQVPLQRYLLHLHHMNTDTLSVERRLSILKYAFILSILMNHLVYASDSFQESNVEDRRKSPWRILCVIRS
jgi:hypothetical protein